MNLADLHRKLILAAKANPPSDRVPYAFEKRIMARIKSHPALDWTSLWARALWRATVPCLAVMILLSAWSLLSPAPMAPSSDLSQDIENTVLAAVEQDQSPDSSW